MNTLCFNNVFYDFLSDTVYIWETVEVDGKIKKVVKEFKAEHYYYILDRTKKSNITDIYGAPVVKIIAEDKWQAKNLRERGATLFESDIIQDIKVLHDRYENCNLSPKIDYYNICYLDIELESGNSFTQEDIEGTIYPINLISFKLSKTGEVHTFGKNDYPGKNNYRFIPDEKTLITEFIKFFRHSKIDFVVGWNIEFDINYILNRARKLGIEEKMSPIGKDIYWEKKKKWGIAGISIIDYMRFFTDPKFAKEKLESYSLQFVGMHELGEGKLQFEGLINDLYKRDWKLFVDYNIQDILLVEKLENKKKYLELIINLCHKSLIPFEKVWSAISIIEGQLLILMHSENKVMSDRKTVTSWHKEEGLHENVRGAYVEATVGYFEEVISYDFESLYPSMILTANISNETLVKNPKNKTGLIKTILNSENADFIEKMNMDEDNEKGIKVELNGDVYYKKEIGMIPKLISINFKERKELKALKKKYEQQGNKELAEFYELQQWIRKIFLNVVYGSVSNNYFHYFDTDMANTITVGGRHLIQYMKDTINTYFNNYFHKNKNFFKEEDEKNVVKGNLSIIIDTDSLYINVKKIREKFNDEKSFLDWCNKFDKEFFSGFFSKALDKYFQKYYNTPNIMNFKMEKIASRMVVFGKKNYAAEVIANEGNVYEKPKIEVTGFASKRSDRPAFCRRKIGDCLRGFFEKTEKNVVEEQIRKVKSEFLKQKIEDISSPRGISDYEKYAKEFKEYETSGLTIRKGTPIHCKAAILYNYIVQKENLPNQLIYSGSKMKYIYVYNSNKYNADVIGYIGNYPESFNKIFKINYEEQFNKTFLKTMQILFDSVGWGTILLDEPMDFFVK